MSPGVVQTGADLIEVNSRVLQVVAHSCCSAGAEIVLGKPLQTLVSRVQGVGVQHRAIKVNCWCGWRSCG